ncbi:MAG: hypothetical protein ACPL28_03690 [bacterium]
MIFIVKPALEFKKLSEVTLEEAYGTYGIYVLWHGRAKTRPSYIGQGDILKRFSFHVDSEMSWPLKGYIAIMGGQHRKTNKKLAELAEAILLDCADLIDKWPNGNAKIGHWRLVEHTLERYNAIRIYLKGYNPFRPPDTSLECDNKKLIQIENTTYEYSSFPWKKRHERTAEYRRI